jgi:hypothetical protein
LVRATERAVQMSGLLSVTWLPSIWQTRLQADVIRWIVGREHGSFSGGTVSFHGAESGLRKVTRDLTLDFAIFGSTRQGLSCPGEACVSRICDLGFAELLWTVQRPGVQI